MMHQRACGTSSRAEQLSRETAARDPSAQHALLHVSCSVDVQSVVINAIERPLARHTCPSVTGTDPWFGL